MDIVKPFYAFWNRNLIHFGSSNLTFLFRWGYLRVCCKALDSCHSQKLPASLAASGLQHSLSHWRAKKKHRKTCPHKSWGTLGTNRLRRLRHGRHGGNSELVKALRSAVKLGSWGHEAIRKTSWVALVAAHTSHDPKFLKLSEGLSADITFDLLLVLQAH